AEGNVGIGTTDPGATLEVAGQIKITGGTPGGGKVLTSDSAGLATWGTATATDTTKVLKAGDTMTGILTSSAGATFAGEVCVGTTEPNANFTVAGSIYVSEAIETATSVYAAEIGIGTTEPTATLEVKGTVKIGDGATAPGANGLSVYGQIRNDSGGFYFNSSTPNDTTIQGGTGQDVSLAVTASSGQGARMEIQRSGLANGSKIEFRSQSGGLTNWETGIMVNSDGYAISTGGLSGAKIFVSTVEGNVGIGTTEPTSKLTVSGTIETIGTGGVKFQDATTQITAGLPLTGGTVSGNIKVTGTASMDGLVTVNNLKLTGDIYNVAWVAWTPTLSVSGGTAPDYTTFTSRYKTVGKTCYWSITWVNASGGTAGTGEASLLFTLPVTPSANLNASSTGGSNIGSGHMYTESGGPDMVAVYYYATTPTAAFKKPPGSDVLGSTQSSAARRIVASGFYEID
ncbi:MAG: hypothetical protein ABH860_04530, partial [bacterium]